MHGAASPPLAQPVPFIVTEQAAPDGVVRLASNGCQRVMLLPDAVAAGGRLFLRRAVRGLALKPAGEAALPQLNALAGELLQHPETPAREVVGRLLAIAGTVMPQAPQHIEWAAAEVGGLYVYTDGQDVLITRQDLAP